MPNFVVVVFEETKEVELVSSNWVQNSTCFWPPFKYSKLKKAVMNHATPENSWTQYNIRKMGTYSTFSKARKALTKAEDTSDLASDMECDGRLRKKSRLASCSSTEEELLNMPAPPSFQEHAIHSNLQESERASTDFAASSEDNHEFQVNVLRELKVVKAIARQNAETLDSILNVLSSLKNDKRFSETVPEDDIFDFPLKTMLDVENLETLLKENDEAENILVKKLHMIGGTNFENSIRRIMRVFMTDELAASFSWMGAKGKRTFSALRSSTAIFGAIRKFSMFSNKSNSEIEFVIKNWLRHATARCKNCQVISL